MEYCVGFSTETVLQAVKFYTVVKNNFNQRELWMSRGYIGWKVIRFYSGSKLKKETFL